MRCRRPVDGGEAGDAREAPGSHLSYPLMLPLNKDPVMHRYLMMMLLSVGLLLQSDARAHSPTPPSQPSQTLTVSGNVSKRLVLDVAALRSREPSQILAVPQGDKEGNPASMVHGIRLRDLLEEARLVTQDQHTLRKTIVVARAADGYKVVFSWSELFNSLSGDSVLVLFERDGNPLAKDEGPIALISAKDLRTGPRHVRWLKEVEVRQVVD